LELRGDFDSHTSIEVPVIAWTEEERVHLVDNARSGELGVHPVVRDQLIRILSSDADEGVSEPSFGEIAWIPYRHWSEGDTYGGYTFAPADRPPTEEEVAEVLSRVLPGGPAGALAATDNTAKELNRQTPPIWWIAEMLALMLALMAALVVWRRRKAAAVVVDRPGDVDDPTD
jgi:hypothetical protein